MPAMRLYRITALGAGGLAVLLALITVARVFLGDTGLLR